MTLVHTSLAALPPTKLVNNGVYKLEVQSEDKYLTAPPAGNKDLAVRSRWNDGADQKWRFTLVDGSGKQQLWSLAPLCGEAMSEAKWKIVYAGHGKYHFYDQVSGLCMAGYGSNVVGNKKCQKDSVLQHWLIKEAKVNSQDGVKCK